MGTKLIHNNNILPDNPTKGVSGGTLSTGQPDKDNGNTGISFAVENPNASYHIRFARVIPGNGTYRFVFWAKASVTETNKLYVDFCDITALPSPITVGTVWQQIIVTATVTNYTSDVYNFIDIAYRGTGTLYMSHFSLYNTKDDLIITIPKFGWAFNPIIADCVNPNNVKINAVLGEVVELEGDYYTLTSANAVGTSHPGYWTKNENNLLVLKLDDNYTTYSIPLSLDKGSKLRFTGLVKTDMYFIVYGQTPILVSASESNPVTTLELTIPPGGTSIEIANHNTVPFVINIGTFDSTQVISDLSIQVSRIGYNGKTQFDLSGLSRMLFNRDEFYKVEKVDNVLYKNLRVSFSYTIGSSTTPIGSANVGVIWGGLQIGETFNQNKTYRYFKGYPFTIPLYLEEKAVLKINDTESETLNAGKYNLDITEDSIVSLFNEYYRKIFTTVFDKTFQPQRISIGTGIEINIEVCDCNLGDTYLRWINTLGEWNYYLFKKTGDVIGSEASDIIFEQYYDTVNYVNNHHAGTGQYTSKKGTRTLNVAAVHLSQDMYDFVRGITLSPIVDLYDNGNWKRVKIGDSDLTKSGRVLQNLEIGVILSDLITQSL